MFVALPGPDASPHPDLHLIRAARRTFSGPAELLHDPVQRERLGGYLADLARPYGMRVPDGLFDPSSDALGQSYGEMAESLILTLVPPPEPVDLLVLAFAIHDMLPGRATATYLSHVCPGTPMSFAICDQGSAAAFSGLRIAREYAASAGCRRALVIAVEQAVLPYDTAASGPARHRGVAMLYGTLHGDTPPRRGDTPTPDRDSTDAPARVAGIRQHADVAADDVAALAATELAELTAAHHDVRVVLSADLASAWPAHPVERVTVTPPGQPTTGLWWTLLDRLAAEPDRPRLVVAADYDPDLRYLCLVAMEPNR
ncbi:2-hydroxy-acid oxidase [Micromonospora sp. NPDC092111]|uniref:2-hydroxy-acid oxidase n=1 Tax=Micromonospora sp. NPDC092111 TaxID=3364289 RepID=UPI00381756AD